MSDFSLTLVLQNKTSKIINDVAKVQQKSEIISAFGGIFFVLDRFDRILSSVIDSHLGLRSTLIAYGKVLHPCRAVCRSVREGEAADRLDYGGDRIPAVRRAVAPLREFPLNCHGCKLLPIHRLAATHVPFRGGSNGQGQELPVQIHRRAGQVD